MAIKSVRSIDRERLFQIKKEFEILQSIGKHPNIVGPIDYIISESTGDAHLVQELAKGQLLDEIMKLGLHYEKLKLIAKQLFESIKFIHDLGVCHRDIKPANIMFDSDSRRI